MSDASRMRDAGARDAAAETRDDREVARDARLLSGRGGGLGGPGRPDIRAMRYGSHAKPKDLGGTLRRLWGLTRGHRGGLVAVLGLAAVATLTPVFSPLLIGSAVGAIDAREPATAAILILIALYLGDWLARFGQQYIMATVGQRIVRDVRLVLFRSMEHLPLAVFDRYRHGDLMSRITNDVDNISSTLSNSLAQLMVLVLTVAGTLVSMLSLSVPLTMIALVLVAAILISTRVVTDHTRPLYRRMQDVLGDLDGHIEESVSGMAMVKAFGRESAMIEQFGMLNEQYRQAATKAQVWSGLLMPMTQVVNNLVFVAVAVASGVMAARGMVSIALVTSFLLYVRQFVRPFVDVANIYNTLQVAVAGAERVFAIMDETPEPADIEGALPCDNPRGAVAFKGVTFGYDPGRPVLHDIDLDVAAGTRVAIVGETGSGKTTLVNLLARLYDVDEGSIELDGHDLREYRLADLRRAFGVVLQEPALFSATVAENICYGVRGDAGDGVRADGGDGAREAGGELAPSHAPDASIEDAMLIERARAAATAVGADAFIERLPQGYRTVLDQGASSLSQGERQLLTIARAIAADAPIIVLDEATSSVDTVTEQAIRNAMLTATSGRTSFVIAHRLATIRDSDIIVVLDEGRIAERGTHDELLAAGGIYAQMWRVQAGE